MLVAANCIVFIAPPLHGAISLHISPSLRYGKRCYFPDVKRSRSCFSVSFASTLGPAGITLYAFSTGWLVK